MTTYETGYQLRPGLEGPELRRALLRHFAHWLGSFLLAFGVLAVLYVGVILEWGDPYTSWITLHHQHQLSGQLSTLENQWAGRVHIPTGKAGAESVSAAAATKALGHKAPKMTAAQLAYAQAARDYGRSVSELKPLGRITIGSIGISDVFVQGTSNYDLEFGPGHYAITGLPGSGGVVAIAGHRTTWLHPFRHIDSIPMGSFVTVDMPYGRFTYQVYRHRIVAYNDWSILVKAPFEKLVLSACHPLHSAAQRYIIYGRLVSERPALYHGKFDPKTNHAVGSGF